MPIKRHASETPSRPTMASPPVSVAAVPSSDVPQLKRTPTIPDDDWEFVDSIIPIVPPRPEFIPGRWRTVRIFISSTFIDMHGERDCLIHEVFPEINNRVKDLYVRVIPVDLRWGVSKEETDTIQTTCLDEIDRCRSHDLDLPWFIGLRGERYGWVQEKYNSPRQFACPLNTQWLKEVDKNGVDLSITSMEVYHAFTGAAAIKRGVASTEHTISHSFFCKRKTEFCNQVAPEHKWIFEFEFKRPDEQIMEANRLQYTVTDRAKRFWLDKQELDQAIVASTLPKVIFEYDCKLDKTEITGQLPNGKRFGCGWVGGLKGFRETLITEITKSIEREYEPPGDLDDDQKESAFHASLIADRAEGFLGRQDLIEQALNYCLQDTKAEVAPMVLVGAPGAGKSAVMARVCQLIQEKKNEDYIYIPHLIGASTDSIYVRKLLMRLCKQLKRQAQVVIAEDVSDDYVILCAQFISILTKTALNKKVVLVIDAINQLAPDHKAHRMKWLPAVLPPNVRILLSTLEFENNTFQNTLEQFPAAKVVNCGALSQTEQTQLVSQYLARYHKKLTQNDSDKFLGNQMALLLAKEQAISPLYLVLACDALRRFGVYEQLTGYIKQLPTTLPKLFVHVLEGVEGVHGKELTVAAFALVAVSRGGLMETEVNAALERMDLGSRVSNFARIYGQTYNFFAAGGSGYLKFFHDQLLYVTRERYSFGGPEPKDLDLTAHSALGGYFLEVVERHMAGAEQYNIEHACAEVVFHLVHAERWANVLDLLSRMDFIVLSLRLRTLADLVADFTIFQNYVEKHARAGSAVDKTTVRQVELIKDALKMSADKVRADVGMAPYQLWCRLNGERALPLVGDLLDFAKWTRGLADQRWGLEGEGAVVVSSDGESKDGEDAPKKKRPAAGQDALHHAAPPPIPAFTTGFNRPGGALQYELYCEGSGCGTLELYDDKVNDCLSALAYTERGEQCFLNTSVLNLDAGVVLASLAPPLYTQTLQNTKGHLWLDAGKRVLTYGHNGTMNLWDLTNTAKTPVLFRGHANCTVWMHWICESVLGVSALTDDPNETRLLSYGNNGKVLLWDRSTAQPHFLYGHSGDNGGGRNGVHGTHVFASGTRAISWGTNQLILWDLMQKCLLSQRQGMREWANNGPWHVIPTKDWKQNGAAALVTSDKFEVLDFNADKIDVQSWEQQIGTMVASEARGSTFFVAAEKSIFTYDLNEKQFQHMPELSRGETGDDSVVPGVSKPKKQAAELVAPTRPPHRYWRITAFEGGKNWNIRQIQFFSDVPRLFEGTESKEQAVDGKVGETTTGGQPFSTSNYPGHPPPSAFDGNLNGCFAFDQDERPMAIGWDFGQGNEKDIRRVRFLNGRDFDGVPEFTVQWSDDGKSWNDDWKMKISNYTEQRGKIWDESVVPGVPKPKKQAAELVAPTRPPHRYWRIAAFEGGKNWNIRQIQFFSDVPRLFEGTESKEQAVDGKVGETTTGGQPFSTSNYPGHPPPSAFDGNLNGCFAFDQDERPMAIGWDFGQGNEKDIRRVRFLNGRDFDGVPEFTVQWSDDGKSWNDDWKMKISNYTEQRGKIWDESVVPGVPKPKKQAAELVAPTRPPHRYWRIAAFEGGKNWNIRQIQFFSDVPRLFGGTESKEQAVDGKVGETTTGGQPFSTSNYPGHPPPSAFDGNLNGCFAFDQDERPMAIGWDFGQGNEKDIRRVRFLNGRDFDGVPEFTVQWSDDGKSWNDDWKMKISNYTEQRGKIWDESVVPGVPKPKKQAAELVAPARPPHRYWRIAAFEGGKNWNIRQIQFFSDVPRLFEGTESKGQAVDGKVGETTTGGQPFSTSNYPGHPPPSAFDGNLNGCFAFDQDERPMAIGWDFGQGNEKDIRRVRFLNGRDFDGVPEFTVQWSDDGKSWNDDWKMKISNYTEQRGKIWDESVVPGVPKPKKQAAELVAPTRPPHRYWRIAAFEGGKNWNIRQIQFFSDVPRLFAGTESKEQAVDGKVGETTTGGQPFSTSNYPGHPPPSAFDGNLNGCFAFDQDERPMAIGWDFGQGNEKDIRRVRFLNGRDFDGVPEFTVQWSDDGKSWNDDWKMKISNYTEQRGKIWDESVVPGVRDRDSEGGDSDSDDEEDDFGFQFDAGFRFWRLSITSSHNNELGLFRFGLLSVEGQDITVSKKAFSSVPTQPSFSPTMALSANPAFYWTNQDAVKNFPVFFTVDVGMPRPACQLVLKPIKGSLKEFSLFASNDPEFSEKRTVQLLKSDHDETDEEVTYNIANPATGVCPRPLTCTASTRVLTSRVIAIGDSDGGVSLLQFPSMAVLSKVSPSPHRSAVLKFFVRADHQVIASSDQSGKLVIWKLDVDKQQLVPTAVLAGGHISACQGALLFANGSFASWSPDAFNYWVVKGDSVSCHPLQGHTNSVTGAFLIPNSGEKQIVSHSDKDMNVIKWDLEKPLQSLLAHAGEIVATLLLTRSLRAVTVSRELFLWDLAEEKDAKQSRGHLLERVDFIGKAVGMELVPLGPAEPETVVVWTEEPVIRLISFPTDPTLPQVQVQALQSHQAGVRGVVQRPLPELPGRVDLLTWATDRNIIYFVHEGPGQYRPVVVEPEPGLRAMSQLQLFDLHGVYDRHKIGILGLTDGTIWTWELDLKTGKYVVHKVAAVHQNMRVLPSQTEAFMSGSSITTYQLPSLQALATQSHGNCFVYDFCGGRRMVTGCTSAMVKLWEVGQATINQLWGGSHDGGLIQGAIHGLKYVAEDIFISWAHDHNIKVWDIKNRTIATLSAHKNDPSGVVFATVGATSFLASWSRAEDRVLLWKLFEEPADGSAVVPIWFASFDTSPAQVVMKTDNDALRIFVSLMDGSVTYFSIPVPLADGTKAKQATANPGAKRAAKAATAKAEAKKNETNKTTAKTTTPTNQDTTSTTQEATTLADQTTTSTTLELGPRKKCNKTASVETAVMNQDCSRPTAPQKLTTSTGPSINYFGRHKVTYIGIPKSCLSWQPLN
eukprot:g986.t1